MSILENTSELRTERLVLRRFRETDAQALWTLLSDVEVNTFLPMFPLTSVREAQEYLSDKYLATYEKPVGFRYAVCLRADDVPIGYVALGDGDAWDFGYALRREFWRQGIVTEAARAVLPQIRRAGIAYITATHDRSNPASGAVMKKIGMTYRYSYKEQWQPKNIPVIFRMYQLNFDGQDERTYKKYWDTYPVHWVEEGV